ncbi:MAG TPA: aldehyde dehydrogenase family protein [Desulfobacterales bacterium]|nr:aldehyde dehydrogenase family protein [Desulfobacterales bacterium]
MLKKQYPYYLANKAVQANLDLPIVDKYSGQVVSHAALADEETISQAIGRAVEAAEAMRRFPAYKRQEVLNHCVQRFTARAEELAQALCVEAGKPIKDSRGEVTRLIETFKIAAEEAVRLHGEFIPLDRSPRTNGYTGITKRVPLGPCSFITPFNFPLNLAAHKVAPAIAAGCPFVMKPASLTPVGALIIGEVLSETDLPAGAFSILPCSREGARLFTEDARLKLLSFTGSPIVGWALKAKAGKKKVVLELGGNAACIIDHDTDITDAVRRVVFGAFYQSGQSCVGVQRILVHADIYESFKKALITATQGLKSGNPAEEDTFIGPMISEKEAKRVTDWIDSALEHGARLLCGGRRQGAILEATLLEGVAKEENLCREEAFGPVAILSSFTDFRAAINEVNDSAFGLQTGVFTRDIYKMNLAWDTLEVGGVIIGDVPSWRADQMPYGGTKDSGLGREGIRYAIEEMTDIRLLVIRDLPV